MAVIERSSFAISVKLGLSDGSDDQHLSISDLHSGSHDSGIGGRNVLLTIPPNPHFKSMISDTNSKPVKAEKK